MSSWNPQDAPAGSICIDETGWLRPGRRVRSENCDERPVGCSVDAVIIHCISLPEGRYGTGDVERLFTNCLDCAGEPSYADLKGLRVSAHLLIDRLGALTQFVSFDRRAWHAGVSCLEGRERCNDLSLIHI